MEFLLSRRKPAGGMTIDEKTALLPSTTEKISPAPQSTTSSTSTPPARKPSHRKAAFTRSTPAPDPKPESTSKATRRRQPSVDASGVATVDLLLLLDYHGYWS